MSEYKNCFSLLSKAHKENKPIVFYDFETEGLKPEIHHPIQFACILVNPDTLGTVKEYTTYINPHRPLESKITEITGITDEALFHAPSEAEVFDRIKDLLGEKSILCGHNIKHFDNKFLDALYERNHDAILYHSMDTLLLAKEFLVKGKDTENFKLGTLASAFGVDKGLTFHDALSDVKATVRVFKVLMEIGYEKNLKPIRKETGSPCACWYFTGYKGMTRVYIRTTTGLTFFWEGMDKQWHVKDGEVKDYDMDTFEKQTLSRFHVSDMDSLLKKERTRWQEKSYERVGECITYHNQAELNKLRQNMEMNHFFYKVYGDYIEICDFSKSKMGKELELDTE